VAATSFTDPVTGSRVLAIVQNDVTDKVEREVLLQELFEQEHRLLESIFPVGARLSFAQAQAQGGWHALAVVE
jgi:hypothetical protein